MRIVDFEIGVRQVLVEEWAPLAKRWVGTGKWRPMLGLGSPSHYEWLGPNVYASPEEALRHLIEDAKADPWPFIGDFVVEREREVQAAVDSWLSGKQGIGAYLTR